MKNAGPAFQGEDRGKEQMVPRADDTLSTSTSPWGPQTGSRPRPQAKHQEAKIHGKDTPVETGCCCNKQQDGISVS